MKRSLDSLTADVLARAASHRDEVTDLTRRLVTIPTENPPGAGYAPCLTAIAETLDGVGLAPRRVEECLLAGHGSGTPVVYFHGHYDVVPAQRREQFEPHLQLGRLYGRGTADMKGGLAAMILAVRVLKDLDVPLRGRVALCVVPDEETAGPRGSRRLAELGLLGADGIAMLTAEPTSGVIWNANRGAVTLRITIRGKHAHVGLQHQGVNAFEHMLVAASSLRELKAEVEQRETRFALEPPEARRSILMMGGRVEGGTGFNAVPSECSFTVDRRINPEEDLETERARLLAILDRLRAQGLRIDHEVLQEAPSASVASDHPVARVLAEAVEAVTRRPPSFAMCPGLLETRFYAQAGVPALAYGPGMLEVSHGPNESVSIDALVGSIASYALTAARLLAP
jgi:acetylornithine deacetylase/succinyl-diaminopimelate desuccinylase family protein